MVFRVKAILHKQQRLNTMDKSARLKEIFNQDSDEEDLQVLCTLKISGKAKFSVYLLSNIDSNINRFKFCQLSSLWLHFWKLNVRVIRRN